MKGSAKMRSILRGGLAGLIIALVAYVVVVRRWLLEWGSTESERVKGLPGDDVVPSPKYETTHGVIVNAPATDVWKWLVQIGQGRGGFYTYDWLENMMSLDIHSVDRIVPELQELKLGDSISLSPGNELPMTVAAFEPGRTLVLRTGSPDLPVEPGDYVRGEIAGSWAFILEPIDANTTRFIVRWRADWRESPLASSLNTVILEPAHCIMERGMLLGIKKRAEGQFEQPGVAEQASAA
jgi:hypothetical protein